MFSELNVLSRLMLTNTHVYCYTFTVPILYVN